MVRWAARVVFFLTIVAAASDAIASAVAPAVIPIEHARVQIITDACTEADADSEPEEVQLCIVEWMKFIDQHMPPTSFCTRNGALVSRMDVCSSAVKRGLRRYRNYGFIAMTFGLIETKIHCNEFILCGAPFPPQL